MKVFIYGGGAVGLGMASCLLKSGTRLALLARPDTVDALRRGGLVRTGIFGDARAEPSAFDAVSTLGELHDAQFDYTLLCVKSYDSEDAARDLSQNRHLLGEQGRIVLFQNGWGNAEVFARFFAPQAVYSARVITGFTRPEKNHVQVTVHADAIHVGSLFGQDTAAVEPLCAAIATGDIPCEAVPDIARDLWAKMLFNCPLNSLGAILGASYGALGESPQARHLMDEIVREVYRVMDAAGYSTHWTSPEAYLTRFYGTLIPLTADHYPSTLQDLQAGKNTEIDALNGAIVALGRAKGVSVPVNETVYRLIRFLERRP